jgi:subtilisin family serine protease
MTAKLWKIAILLAVSTTVFSQQQSKLSGINVIEIPNELRNKVGSGNLIEIANEKSLLSEEKGGSFVYLRVAIYLDQYPSSEQLNSFQSLGILCNESSWTPPLYDHPYGFILAEIPVNGLIDALSLGFVKKIDGAEQLSFPQNNESVKIINADKIWTHGWMGEGVKVGILDSGLDTDPLNPDLPSTIIKKDYSSYPTIDDDVENHVTGHGTHVTGSVLGRGTLSVNNIGNGGNPYQGVAPSANLVFLKIGNDFNAGASTYNMTCALDAAVNIYNVDVISMSYGLWDAYHDGSSLLDQKVDWCYSQGVPVFLAAGNDGSSARHYSGLVAGNDSSDFIKVNVVGAVANSSYLYFNLVWQDGLGVNNNLNYKYYDETFQEISNVYNFSQTESTKGTESRYSKSVFKLPAGNSVYYLRIINYSPNSQPFHIYEKENNGKVSFDDPDPFYTILSPATATYGFCVGAFTSREEWVNYNGSFYSSNEIQNEIASYSSRGPRIDELQKPDILAPGSAIISIRDRDVLVSPNRYWIDNDGNPGGDANYYVMEGTSMAAPQCAGAAALFLNKVPDASPSEVYDAIREYASLDQFTGTVPNSTYGYGKLDIFAAINSTSPLPVELKSFSAVISDGIIVLSWRTETELNNYGFQIERLQNYNIEILPNWETIGFVKGYGNSISPRDYSFTDDLTLTPDLTHTLRYRLKQIDNNGDFEYSKIIEVDLGSPGKFELSQNYPNPFNPVTTIRFSIPASPNPSQGGASVKLIVYNLLGEEVAVLVNQALEAGVHTVNFSVESVRAGLQSGVYIYKLESNGFVQSKKMTLLK